MENRRGVRDASALEMTSALQKKCARSKVPNFGGDCQRAGIENYDVLCQRDLERSKICNVF